MTSVNNNTPISSATSLHLCFIKTVSRIFPYVSVYLIKLITQYVHKFLSLYPTKITHLFLAGPERSSSFSCKIHIQRTQPLRSDLFSKGTMRNNKKAAYVRTRLLVSCDLQDNKWRLRGNWIYCRHRVVLLSKFCFMSLLIHSCENLAFNLQHF